MENTIYVEPFRTRIIYFNGQMVTEIDGLKFFIKSHRKEVPVELGLCAVPEYVSVIAKAGAKKGKLVLTTADC